MNGKGIYFSLAALLGILTSLVDALLFLLLFLLYLFLLRQYKSFLNKPLILIIIVYACYGFIGGIATHENKSKLTGNEQQLTVVLQNWETDGDWLRMLVKEERTAEKLLLQYRLKSEEEKNFVLKTLLHGASCKIKGELTVPETARNPNAFNYQHYLSSKQIYWILTSEQFPLQSCSQNKPTIQSSIEKLRTQGMNYLNKNFPEPTSSLAIALLFGEQNPMSENLIESYQKIGIIHLIAISGLQVSFLSGMLFWIGIRLGIIRETVVQLLLLFLPFYALITGASPSVVRAVLMMMLILISLNIRNQRFPPLDALCAAFLISLFFFPFLIFDIGFQLSFVASFSLLFSTKILVNAKKTGTQLLLTSAIAQLGTLPIILFQFYEISVLSLLANFLFVPFFSIILTPLIFFLFILHPIFPSLLHPVFWITNQVIILVNRMIIFLSELPLQMLIVGRPGILLVFFYILTLFIIATKWEWQPKKLLRTSSLLIIPILLQISINIWSPSGEITFIDVGQGDSILIKLPFGKGTYLIDTGGNLPFTMEAWQKKNSSFEVGKDLVVPFIKSKGIFSIDKLILTHGDYDHIGGAKAVIDGLHVKELLLPKSDESSDLEKEIMKMAGNKGMKISFVTEGTQWRSGTSRFQILSPAIGGSELDKNNRSIVVYAQIGNLSWLFTGDLEKEREFQLVKEYPPFDVDVLKVGHHGSDTSTSVELLSHITPEVAVISVGEKNRYGHPSKETLLRLQQRNITILRTDEHGAISYIFKNGRGTFSVQIP